MRTLPVVSYIGATTVRVEHYRPPQPIEGEFMALIDADSWEAIADSIGDQPASPPPDSAPTPGSTASEGACPG